MQKDGAPVRAAMVELTCMDDQFDPKGGVSRGSPLIRKLLPYGLLCINPNERPKGEQRGLKGTSSDDSLLLCHLRHWGSNQFGWHSIFGLTFPTTVLHGGLENTHGAVIHV